MKRIFIAINFNTSFLRKDLEAIKKGLEGEPIKWVEIQNIHLTLLFLGSVHTKKMGFIDYAIEKNIKILPQFKVDLKSLGDFSKVIWMGAKIENQENLEKFQNKIKEELQQYFTTKEQRFIPHITIGRIKGNINQNKIKSIVKKYKNHHFGSANIDSVDIIESELTDKGPVYKIIRKFEL